MEVAFRHGSVTGLQSSLQGALNIIHTEIRVSSADVVEVENSAGNLLYGVLVHALSTVLTSWLEPSSFRPAPSPPIPGRTLPLT